MYRHLFFALNNQWAAELQIHTTNSDMMNYATRHLAESCTTMQKQIKNLVRAQLTQIAILQMYSELCEQEKNETEERKTERQARIRNRSHLVSSWRNKSNDFSLTLSLFLFRFANLAREIHMNNKNTGKTVAIYAIREKFSRLKRRRNYVMHKLNEMELSLGITFDAISNQRKRAMKREREIRDAILHT